MENDFSWQRSKSYRNWKESGNFVREGKKAGFLDDELVFDEWIKQFEDVSIDMLKRFQYK